MLRPKSSIVGIQSNSQTTGKRVGWAGRRVPLDSARDKPFGSAQGRHLFRTVSLLKRQAHAYALRATAGRQECLPRQRGLGGAVHALSFEDQLARQVAEEQPFHPYRLIHQQAGDVEGQVIELSH